MSRDHRLSRRSWALRTTAKHAAVTSPIVSSTSTMRPIGFHHLAPTMVSMAASNVTRHSVSVLRVRSIISFPLCREPGACVKMLSCGPSLIPYFIFLLYYIANGFILSASEAFLKSINEQLGHETKNLCILSTFCKRPKPTMSR